MVVLSVPTSNIVYLPPRLSIGGGSNKTHRLRTQFRPSNPPKRQINSTAFRPTPIPMRSLTKCRALSAAQTQTMDRKAATIDKAPTHIKEKSPRLDDGGTGFPPRLGGGGGGGGGGGEGESYGGGYLFLFLMFMNLLQEIEEQETKRRNNKNRHSRRRR